MFTKVACFVLLSMIVVAPHARASVTCGQVAIFLSSCIPYLMSGGTVPENCCSAVRSLNAAASTTADRRTACSCLKSFAGSPQTSINANIAAGLPGACGLNIGFEISTSTVCSKIQ